VKKKMFCLFLAVILLLSGCSLKAPGSTLPNETLPPMTEAELTQKLQRLLDTMSVEQRVGQLFLAACSEINPSEAIENHYLGGFILFREDFFLQTRRSMTRKLEKYQQSSTIPMLIAVDEEGGSVCRVSSNIAFRSKRFSSPRDLLNDGGVELLLKTETEKCNLLKSLGINVNLAPVCDITTDSKAFMYPRSMGKSPEETAGYIQQMLSVMQSYRVGSVLKHFPGYGNNTDTHVAMAVDNRSLKELEEVDLIPFQAGIDAGCGAVMVSHTIVSALDDKNPATLSGAVHDYLRIQMGFDGVIMTDDLTMTAITDHYGAGEAAVLAVLAGNDMLCTGEYAEQYEAVLKAVRTGRISVEQLNASVMRILRWKAELGLLNALLADL